MLPPVDFVDKIKKKRKGEEGIYTTAYYTLGGLVAGMVIADLWDRLDLPKGKIENALLTQQEINKSPYDKDTLYQNILAGLVMASEAFGVKGGVASGVGMIIGMKYSNISRKGDYIGGTPSP